MTAFSLAILTACIWGMIPMMEKHGLRSVSPDVGILCRSFGVILGLPLVFAFVPHWRAEMTAQNGKAIALLVLGGFLGSIVAQMVNYRALQLGDVSRVTPVAGSYPLIAFLLGIFVLGEALTPQKLLGVMLTVVGIGLLK